MAAAGVEHRDIASGKVARVFAGAFNILANGPNPPVGGKRPCRAIAVSSGPCEIVGLDGVNVVLPDMGGAFWWDVQAVEIVSGSGAVIY